MNITKENSDDLGFVLSSVSCQAITIQEFKDWVAHVIGNHEYPDEFIELLEVEFLMDVLKKLSFSPTLENQKQIEKALYGVAYKRFGDLFDASIEKAEAQEALETDKLVIQRFEELFPFIEM